MTCHEAKTLLKGEGLEGLRPKGSSPKGRSSADYDALAIHLQSCRRCGEAMQVARLSSALFQSLREKTAPTPTFYPRLRARLAGPEIGQSDATLLHAWGFARRLIPALAMGVLLLAGVTLSLSGSQSPQPVQVGPGREIHAFSLEELNLPAAVGQPSQDQVLAFVLMRDAGCDVQGATCEDEGSRLGTRDGSYDRNTR